MPIFNVDKSVDNSRKSVDNFCLRPITEGHFVRFFSVKKQGSLHPNKKGIYKYIPQKNLRFFCVFRTSVLSKKIGNFDRG